MSELTIELKAGEVRRLAWIGWKSGRRPVMTRSGNLIEHGTWRTASYALDESGRPVVVRLFPGPTNGDPILRDNLLPMNLVTEPFPVSACVKIEPYSMIPPKSSLSGEVAGMDERMALRMAHLGDVAAKNVLVNIALNRSKPAKWSDEEIARTTKDYRDWLCSHVGVYVGKGVSVIHPDLMESRFWESTEFLIACRRVRYLARFASGDSVCLLDIRIDDALPGERTAIEKVYKVDLPSALPVDKAGREAVQGAANATAGSEHNTTPPASQTATEATGAPIGPLMDFKKVKPPIGKEIEPSKQVRWILMALAALGKRAVSSQSLIQKVEEISGAKTTDSYSPSKILKNCKSGRAIVDSKIVTWIKGTGKNPTYYSLNTP